MYKVLIVEDDPMVAMINEQYVCKNNNFTVAASCRNGQEALDYLSKNSVDLVVLDVFMPLMGGVETLKKIREQKISTEVIMVTAANDTATLEETMHLGVLDYLIKPFAFDRFQISLEKFAAKYQALHETKVLDQSNIDSIIQNNSKPVEKELPKGIQKKTLELILNFFNQNPGWQSGDTIAEKTGLSSVTIRHYMSYMAGDGQISETINYETGGRPSSLYKVKKQFFLYISLYLYSLVEFIRTF